MLRTSLGIHQGTVPDGSLQSCTTFVVRSRCGLIRAGGKGTPGKAIGQARVQLWLGERGLRFRGLIRLHCSHTLH